MSKKREKKFQKKYYGKHAKVKSEESTVSQNHQENNYQSQNRRHQIRGYAKSKKKAKIRKRNKRIIQFIQLILIIILVYSLIQIVIWYKNNKNNENILNDISSAIIIEDSNQDGIEEEKYKIDFAALKQMNSETVGFLKVNGTNIEYPVVKAKDNDFYINHSFNRTYNDAGWIFADYRNRFDGTDRNTVIYGHNRRDGSMFATLKNTLKEEWYKNEENLKIKFITENEEITYEVFSIYQIEAEAYYISTNFKNNEAYNEFLNTITKRSYYDFNIELTTDDTIFTLSTCASNNKYRVVLHAKRINE